LGILALIVVALVAYWPSTSGLWHYWTDDLVFGGHGLLVAGLALWLLWRARARIAAAPVRREPRALPLLIFCSLASLIFWKASIEELQFLMLPALVLLGILSAFGPHVIRSIAVPVCFLYFAMPVWNLLAGPLQSLTLVVVRLVAPVIGVPAAVSGSFIYLPEDMKFNVGLVCSGSGFLVQGLAVAALLGELEEASWGRRLRLMGSMAIVAVVTNWIRVLAIVQIGYSSGMRHVLVTRHHLLFGCVLFMVVLVAFVWVARQRALPDAPQATVHTLRSTPPAAGAYAAALCALAAPPVLAHVLTAETSSIAASELQLPAGQQDWHGPLEGVDATWRPVFVGSHGEWRGVYRDRSGHTVEVVAIGYNAQAQGRELVNEDNSLLGNGGLTLLMSAAGSGRRYREDVAVDERAQRSVIWSFYVIGDRLFVTPVWAQLWYGINAFGTPPYSALFALRSACSPSCAEARVVLADFMHVMRPEVLAATRPVQLQGREAPAATSSSGDAD
jgi:EpsI family protein